MEYHLRKTFANRYYFGIPAPTISSNNLDSLDIQRIELIKSFNITLKEEVIKRGSYFLDVYKLTKNEIGTNNILHMIDKTHLVSDCLGILFNRYLSQ